MRQSKFFAPRPVAQGRDVASAPSLLIAGIVIWHLFVSEHSFSYGQRSLGIDVSAWQGNISQTTWNNIHDVENREFVYIRSSRGGTTGYYNQHDSSNSNGQNTLSQRYDDPYFVQNMTRATNAGLYAGSYHFSRPDVVASTQNSNGVANTGRDEADHFIQMAGAWMRPGYLLPVHDLEAGDGWRTDNEMAQFALDFSDRVHEVMGIRPAIYTNGNYANFVVGGASPTLRLQVVETYPTLWSARWPSNPDVQTEHPSTSLSWVYGPWDDAPNPTDPWSFWQYSSTGRLSSFNNGNSNLDLNVAQGGTEFLKDQLVPALWTTASDGEWTELSNWNSGLAPIAPVQGPGQVPRAGRLRLPAARLPTADDTVILDHQAAEITVTLSSGIHEIRKLIVREALHLTAGALTVNYIPTNDSTTYSAQFSAPVALSGGSLSVHTTQVDAAQTFSLGGTLSLHTLQLMPDSTDPATLKIIGDISLVPLNDASAAIVSGPGTGERGIIDLEGHQRIWHLADGLASVDLTVEVPIRNGGLTKAGLGTLKLSGPSTYAGDTVILAGGMRIDEPFLNDAADVYLSTEALLQLDFLGTDVIDALIVEGVSQAVGTWGGLSSGADHTTPLISGTGLLQVTGLHPPIPGDFNNDGVVDGFDLTQWAGDYGQGDGSDADADGDSDGADFLIWQRSDGATFNAGSGARAIPEPSTCFLAIMSISAIVLHSPICGGSRRNSWSV